MIKIKEIIYYLIIIFLFLTVPVIINFYMFSDKTVVNNKILELENQDLKKELLEITNLNYGDYDYYLAKIIIKNIYESDVSFLKTEEQLPKNLAVINQSGLIGITGNNNIMYNTSSINLSVKVNNKIGKIENKTLIIDTEVNKGDLIYTSGLTNIPANLLIGEVDDNLKVKYINNYNNYVAVLKEE